MPDWMGDGSIAFPNLGIYLENVPKNFTVFGFTIALYGVIIGIGMFVAVSLVVYMAQKAGYKQDDFYDLALTLIICGIIGARLYYVIFSWEDYKDNLLSILNIRQGGLAIYGGVIAGFIALCVFCKIKKMKILAVADLAILGVLTGQIFGRWGNFTNRECFGGYTDGLFAMRLPLAAVRSSDLTPDILEHIAEGTNYIQVHPTYLYESMANLVLLILILLFWKKKKFDGEMMLCYFGGYGIIRFFVEGLRTDSLLLPATNIAVSQLLGILLFVVSLALWVVMRVKQYQKEQTISGD
ncbi:MAG: prolipoprotein diacylglyceryl transferase [Lachnospiraceae bacterium]